MDSKVKGQLSKDIVVQKKKISSNTAAEDKRIECSRTMRKSISFSSNATDAKVKPLPSNFSLVEDLKKLNRAKWKSTQGKYTSVLQSKVSSPVANSGDSASLSGKEIVSHGETFSSGSKYHDIEAVEGHEQSNNSLNAFSHLAQKGLKYRDEFDDRQERDTRKQDMNLKPCFQESSEHIVDQERESKNSRVSKNSADRFPFGRNGVSPTTFSEDNFRKCGEYDVSKSSTEGQVPKNKLKKQGVMPSFLGEMDNKINQEKHSEPQTNKNNKDGDEDPLLLSLSLAFPFSNQV
nr:hypothetical protein CFP56_32933 [Quercus suber]